MNALLAALYSFCKAHGLSKTYWIAFSGGLDSTVLLALSHALTNLYPVVRFHVIHIDHSLSGHSKEWVVFAKEQAKQYGFPFFERTIIHARAKGESLEAYARKARYAFFAELMQPDDVVLTAHHQDDQAETVLLQLMRGAGVKGLAAMPAIKPFAKGWLGRPLLSFSREELLAFAKEKALRWIDDASNGDVAFSRNYIRHEIMPRLKTRWTKAPLMLARSAENCAHTQLLVDEYVRLREVAGSRENTLSVKKLMGCSKTLRFMMIRQWIMKGGFYPPERRQLQQIEETVINSQWDKTPRILLGGVVLVRRYRDDLYLDQNQTRLEVDRLGSDFDDCQWNLMEDCDIPLLGRLQAVLTPEGCIPAHIASLNVRFMQPSERIAVLGRGKRHLVKNLFQEWGVPPWLRHCTPMLFLEDELVGVPGYYWSYALRRDEAKNCSAFKIIFHINQ